MMRNEMVVVEEVNNPQKNVGWQSEHSKRNAYVKNMLVHARPLKSVVTFLYRIIFISKIELL
jgi:hypothetical protein